MRYCQLSPPCPQCGSNSSRIYDPRYLPAHNSKERKRVCLECSHRFVTEEKTVRSVKTKFAAKKHRHMSR